MFNVRAGVRWQLWSVIHIFQGCKPTACHTLCCRRMASASRENFNRNRLCFRVFHL